MSRPFCTTPDGSAAYREDRMTRAPRDRFRDYFSGVRFRWERPLALKAYRRRTRARLNRRFPVEWLTPASILDRDLELYEPDDLRFALSEEMLEKFAQTRDSLKERIRRISTISFLLYALLISNYFAVDLEVDFIVNVKTKFPGFREILITAASFIGFYNLILQNNVYTIENFMKFIVRKTIPPELYHVYSARLFPDQTFTRYMPTNLPRLTTGGISYYISVLPILFGLIVLLTSLVLVFTVNGAILTDIWLNPSLPIWSRATVVAIIANFAFCLLYLISTRSSLPYRNYSVLEEMEVLKELAPSQYARKFKDFYKEDFVDKEEMKRRGFLQEWNM